MPTRPAIEFELVEDAGDWPALAEDTGPVFDAVAAVAASSALETSAASVTIVLSSDSNVAALNGQFRNKQKPTNVLSFPAGPGSPDGYLGDIILAEETIQREAAEQEITFEHHLQHLVVHGLLHLLGHDHEEPAAAERMEKLEIEILSTLGIANPYTGELETAKSG